MSVFSYGFSDIKKSYVKWLSVLEFGSVEIASPYHFVRCRKHLIRAYRNIHF